ncbi:MAG: DUF4157 domain-containing protein [Anaerolineaceae bacterium]|nr:DUF4157 domain-containing protein [Anaerolineaceae bacterium]
MSTVSHEPVKHTSSQSSPFMPALNGSMHRKCTRCDRALKREAEYGDPAQLYGISPIVSEVLNSPGQPLDHATRAFMESRFGHDLGRVRVHADAKAQKSAQAVNANAYTVGSNIVFAPGRYLPGTPDGQRLLAHELTHVLQQRNGLFIDAMGKNQDSYEVEAERVANAVTSGASIPFISTSRLALQKEDAPGSSDAQSRASRAEFICDMTTLCQLRFSNPDVVNRDRVFSAYHACHPGTTIMINDPCLSLSPSLIQSIVGGTRTAPRQPAAGAAASSAGGGLSLPSTEFHFSLGPAAFDISIPSSVSATLPIPFQGARNVVLNLSGGTSGEFSFSVTINAIRHVQIIARAGVRVTGDQRATAGLVIQTTRTTCQTVDEAAARSMLQGAGEKLRDAIRNLQNPPPSTSGQSDIAAQFEPASRWVEVGSAISGVHSAIERVRAGCREVPVASLEFGVRTPLGTFTPGVPPTERDLGNAPFAGVSATFHF